MKYLKKIIKEATGSGVKIVFPEADICEKTLQAVYVINKKKLADVILLGDDSALVLRDKNLANFKIINPKTAELKTELAKMLYEKRKAKGLTENEAKKLIQNPYYFGTMLVEAGYADAMIAGTQTQTATVLRPALQLIKTQTGLASSCMLLVGKRGKYKNKPFLLSDVSLNENPTAEQLSNIAIQTCQTADALGFKEKKLVFLSYSTKGSADGEMIKKVQAAVQNFALKDVVYDGEFQLDAAINAEVAIKKAPNSPIIGDANILIVPDLNTGNILYKSMQYFGEFTAIGPIVQGLNKPVNDLSRGASVKDIINLTAITALSFKRKEK